MTGLILFKKRFFITDAISPSPIVFSYNMAGQSINKPHRFLITWSDGEKKKVKVNRNLYRSLGWNHHYKIIPTRALKRLNFRKKSNHFILQNFFCKKERSRFVQKVEVFVKSKRVAEYACRY
jgi:hypothetical protein